MDTIPTHPIYIAVSRINFSVLQYTSDFDAIIGDLGMIVLKKKSIKYKRKKLYFTAFKVFISCFRLLYYLFSKIIFYLLYRFDFLPILDLPFIFRIICFLFNRFPRYKKIVKYKNIIFALNSKFDFFFFNYRISSCLIFLT